MKEFIQAPLPFQGQKRNFLKAFKECLNEFKDKDIFVDLFGGSGLLSHTIKQMRPEATVIFNDYDWYITRLQNIDKTNRLLAKIRNVMGEKNLAKGQRLDDVLKGKIVEIIRKKEEMEGYVDYITLSTSLLFSGQFATDFEDLVKECFYNQIKQKDYEAEGYLEGVEVMHMDYKMLFDLYKYSPKVCFVLDPPYLSTDCSSYKSQWKLKDYLDVLLTLQGTSYFYFTSNKTSIPELCQWLAMHTNLENPLENACCRETSVGVNKDSKYRDLMFYRNL